MLSHRFAILSVVLSFILLLIPSHAQSNPDGQVQEFFSSINPDNPDVFFDLFGMEAGTTIYVYAESYEFDTYTGICDIDCEIDIYAFNDDIDGRNNRNSAFSYTFEEDGDYSIFVTDCCDFDEDGVFRVLIGLEAPDVLTGEAFPVGDPFVTIYQPTYINLSEFDYDEDEPQAQQFYGTISPDQPVIFYEILDAQAGQTLYAYVESTDFDTALGLCTNNCTDLLAEEDDIAPGNLNTALSYTFEADGSYRLIVADCCDENASGRFRLVLGYNEPNILKDQFLPNGAHIAEIYSSSRSLVQADIERQTEVVRSNCENITLNERPELSGPMVTLETDNFVIHYTTSGEDRAELDYVQDVADFVEDVLLIQTQQLGWPAPPQDCGEGGDIRYDFYLMNLLENEGILGYAEPEEVVGDNPNSQIIEEWAAYGYMVIDSSYDSVSAPRVVMRATIAHEFHHLVQFGYDIADAAFWVYEATASWIETVTSDEQDATDYTSAVFDEPQLCLGSMDDREGLRIYGEWLLIDSIAQDYGIESIVQLWEILAIEEGMDAFYEFVDLLNTTPEAIIRNYAIRNLLRDYALGDEFPGTVDTEAVIEDYETYESGRNGIEELGMQYLLIRGSRLYELELDTDDLMMVAVGINPNANEVDVFDLGTMGTIDTRPYDYSYIILINPDPHRDPDDCDEIDWELTVREGSNEDLIRSTDETFNAIYFNPTN
ncbi:MAG: hypothetical protein ACFE0Q_02445 [Anaerolineae bacterium]